MVLSTRHCHFVETFLKPVNDHGHYCGILMQCLGVIDIPGNGALLTVNQTVGDAGIVRALHKTHVFQRGVKELVLK